MASPAVNDKWSDHQPGDIPKGTKKEFLSFIKTIASFKGDLSSFTAPPFILSTTSLAEYPAYWAEQPSRFVASALCSEPSKRALLVLTWFLTTLKQQYDHRKDRKRGKPLNPVLGELFLGKFPDPNHGSTEVISEQVCHHPPVTAYRVWNEQNGISLTGYHAAKTFFANRMIHMHKLGQVKLHIDKYDEDYLLTFPHLHLEGFLPPPPYPEFDNEPVCIVSSSGYTSKITFSGKGWLRGKRNSFFAQLYPTDVGPNEPLFSAEGQWTGVFTVKNARTGEVVETYDANESTKSLTAIDVAPLAEQDPMESRKLWNKFTTCMYERNMSGVSAEKNRIEVRQRELRKEEEANGKQWQMKYFAQSSIDTKLQTLCEKVGMKIEPELTNGFWRFDQEMYKQAEKRSANPFGDDKLINRTINRCQAK